MEKHSEKTEVTSHAGSSPDDLLSVIASNKVVLEDGICRATLVVSKQTGKILAIHTSVLPRSFFPPSVEYYDYTPNVVMPGLVDTHVHVNEPGRTSTEGFFTATRAAIFGGVTTIVDMPLNSIPATTTVSALHTKIKAANNKCWCDVGFLGGIIPGNKKELKPLINAGVRGFKSFLIDSRVPEFPAVSYTDVRDAMIELAQSPTMLLFHAEKIPEQTPDLERLRQEPGFLYPKGYNDALHVYNNFLASHPPVFEDEAIRMLVDLSQFAPNLPLHVAHVSTAEALPILRQAQDQGVNISAETCFHYLSLAAEDVPLRDTRFKSDPPIRSKNNQDELWRALRRLSRGEKEMLKPPKKDLRLGPITTIVSDHSPCSPQAKFLPSYIPPHPGPGDGEYYDDALPIESGDFFKAWGGIASVGLGLPVLWTDFCERRWNIDSDFPLVECDDGGKTGDAEAALIDTVEWCCRNTAELVGLGQQKGRLKVGYDGDVCVFDPSAKWVLGAEDLLFKHKMTPYEGRSLKGRVMATWLRGRRVWSLSEGFTRTEPGGKLLLERRWSQQPDAEQNKGSYELTKYCFGWTRWLWDAVTLPSCGCFGQEAESSAPRPI